MYRKRKYEKMNSYNPVMDMKFWKKKFVENQNMVNFLEDQRLPNRRRGTAYSKNLYGDSWDTADPAQLQARAMAGFYGRGDYKSFFRNAGAAGLRGAGRFVGNYFGGPAGGELGHNAGAGISKWLGLGKYKRRTFKRKNYRGRGDYGGDAGGNQIMAGSVDTPMTVNASDNLTGDICLAHREFLGNITATGGAGNISPFALQSYFLNPGLNTTFPWLAQIAQNFELYEFEGLIFEYKPTSGELGATGTNALGKIAMATNYDPDAQLFTSTVQMENYDYANACKPSEHMMHGVETEPKQRATNLLYVRTGSSTRDKVFTDVGIFQIATEGLPITNGTTANIGELWVTYKIKLSRALLYGSLLGQNIGADYLVAQASASNIAGQTSTWISANPSWVPYFPNPNNAYMAPRYYNTIGVVAAPVSGHLTTQLLITFPPNIISGTYRIIWHIVPGGNVVISFSDPVVTNGSLLALNGIDYYPLTNTENTTTTTTQTAIQTFQIKVASPGSLQCTVLLAVANALPANSATNLSVSQMPTTN